MKHINLEYMFYNYHKLEDIDFGLNNYEVNAMAYAFLGCTILPDFTNFDLS